MDLQLQEPSFESTRAHTHSARGKALILTRSRYSMLNTIDQGIRMPKDTGLHVYVENLQITVSLVSVTIIQLGQDNSMVTMKELHYNQQCCIRHSTLLRIKGYNIK